MTSTYFNLSSCVHVYRLQNDLIHIVKKCHLHCFMKYTKVALTAKNMGFLICSTSVQWDDILEGYYCYNFHWNLWLFRHIKLRFIASTKETPSIRGLCNEWHSCMLYLHPTHVLAGQSSVTAWTTGGGAHNMLSERNNWNLAQTWL